MGALVTGVGIGAAAVGSWLLLYALILLATRPDRPRPAPATQDLGAEPPAVVSLLVNRWGLTEDAAEATLLDLAARHHLELRQPGNDPMQTTVHLRDPHPVGLTRYEQRIFDRVATLAVDGVVPLPALTFRDPAQATAFDRAVRAEIVADARARGLSRRRLGPLALSLLSTAALVAGLGVTLAALVAAPHHTGNAVKSALFAGLVTVILLGGVAHRPHGERDTPAGREACARWLGVRAWLRNTEAFADLPPAAVAVWDRYLAYGAAVGATRVSSAVIDLGMGNRRRVWSSYGGTWHRVRVRYPRVLPRYGSRARALAVRGTLAALAGTLLLVYWSRLVDAVAADPSIGPHTVGGATSTVTGVGLLLGALLLGYGLYTLVRTVIDVSSPVTLTGQVLWRQVWRSTSGGENSPPRPWLHYLAIDDGTGDSTTAWGVPSQDAARCVDGDTVTVKVRRWTRRVVELTVVTPGSGRRLIAAPPTGEDTEALIVAAMGLPTPARATARVPVVAPAALLTAEEVTRAIGVPVTPAPATPGGSPLPFAATGFVTPDGRQAVLLTVLSGVAGRLALAARRGSPPLPGLGDEAYTGEGWAVARRGDLVVGLVTQGAARAADPRNVYWLLSTALARLPVPAGPG